MTFTALKPAPAATPLAEPAWSNANLANPHAVADKARRVNQMFSAIAPSYDLNNRLHSMWRDQAWRRFAVRFAQVQPGDTVLDVACGTGDLSLAFLNARPARVIGLDFCHPMLEVAVKKAEEKKQEARSKKQKNCVSAQVPQVPRPKISPSLSFHDGDATRLPIADRSVNVVSIAFGIRNVANWGAAIDEFFRVLKPGGRLIVLEFSLPQNVVLRGFYNFYFRKIMPRTATLISGDRSGAYKYLPESVNTFITRETMMDRMRSAGFQDVTARALTFGICICYRGTRHA